MKRLPRRGNSFDEDGMVGVISQRIAEFLQRAVQAEIESVSRPEPLLQFLTRNHFAGVFQQGLKYLKGLLLELDPGASFAKLSSRQVDVEDPEPEHSRGVGRLRHRTAPLSSRVYHQDLNPGSERQVIPNRIAMNPKHLQSTNSPATGHIADIATMKHRDESVRL